MSKHKLLNVAEIENLLAELEDDPGKPGADVRIQGVWNSICQLTLGAKRDALMQRYRMLNTQIAQLRAGRRKTYDAH